MHFGRLRLWQNDPTVMVYDTPIQVATHIRYLGLTLDSRLDWKEHINYLKASRHRSFNVMLCRIGINWGSVLIYRSFILSKLDYVLRERHPS